jgi:hypothetical protein
MQISSSQNALLQAKLSYSTLSQAAFCNILFSVTLYASYM